tara:strand:- start:936 stop:1064 length:129 start_codon:yes stop_codon:yes gene_type:complete
MVGQIGMAMDLPMPKNSSKEQISITLIRMAMAFPMDGKSLMD